MNRRGVSGGGAACLAAAFFALPAAAQEETPATPCEGPSCPTPVIEPKPPQTAGRTSENAVTQPEDAFGTSVGRETIGLYSTSSVRGFSPFTAGNVRIDGLYYDPVWTPSNRIRRASAIRVGLSAQGFAFPAPTGIVDYAMRRPEGGPSASLYAMRDTYEGAALEVDTVLPVTGNLRLAAGAGYYNNSFYNGTAGGQRMEGATALWRPTPQLEIQPFWSQSDVYDDEYGAVYVPAGSYLPPDVPRRRFLGPDLPKYRSTAVLHGALLRYDIGANWQVRALGVRTFFADTRTADNLMIGVRPDRSVDRHLFIVDPPTKRGSTSGELRLTRRIETATGSTSCI